MEYIEYIYSTVFTSAMYSFQFYMSDGSNHVPRKSISVLLKIAFIQKRDGAWGANLEDITGDHIGFNVATIAGCYGGTVRLEAMRTRTV